MCVPVEDNLNVNISRKLFGLANYIAGAQLLGENVLIYDSYGYQISTTVVCAFLIKEKVISIEAALKIIIFIVGTKAMPHSGLIMQLTHFS